MKTSFNAVELMYGILAGSAVKGAITGGIYTHHSRPLNSQREDVVVNSLPINNNQLQLAVVMINIHAPKIKVMTVDGVEEEKDDTARLSELTSLIVSVVDQVWEEDYSFVVQQHQLLYDSEAKEQFSNIRVEFNSENF